MTAVFAAASAVPGRSDGIDRLDGTDPGHTAEVPCMNGTNV